MNEEQLKECLLPLRPHEFAMKQYFNQYPKAYAGVNGGWEDFKAKCRREYGRNLSFPNLSSRFFLGPELTEAECFANTHQEVQVILHDRFFPPYRQHVGFLKILYSLSGSAEFYYNQEKVILSAGDFVIVPPGADHAVFSGSADALTLNIVIKKSTFGSAFASLLAGKDLISDFFWKMLYSKTGADALLFQCGSDARLLESVIRLYEETVCEQNPNDVLIKGLVILFFGTVIKYHAQNVVELISEKAVRKVFPGMIRYILENYQTVTLSTLAEHFHRSEGYVSRYIHAETGTTFRLLLREFRLEQAAEMLRSSECTIEEIVNAIGYTEASRFYRNFKERFGLTPTAYRERTSLPGVVGR